MHSSKRVRLQYVCVYVCMTSDKKFEIKKYYDIDYWLACASIFQTIYSFNKQTE
jgi:hypothetical protein